MKKEYNALVNLILLFFIPSMLQNFPVVGLVPQAIGGIIVLICILILIKKITVKKFIIIFYMGGILITTILYSDNLSLNLKDSIYFISFILLGMVVSEKNFMMNLKEILNKKVKTIKFNVIVGNLILILGLISPSAYFYEWGEGATYFSGFTYMPHVVAALCIMLILFTIIYIKYEHKSHKYYAMLIIPIYCILKTGARAYLIPLFIISLLILIRELGALKTSVLGLISSPILISLFMKTSMFKKFIMLLNFEQDFSMLHKLTSGRSEMWSGLIYHYTSKYNFLEKVMGRSFDNIYQINYMYSGMDVWAHNDVINLLLTTGIVGVIIYLNSFFCFYKISRFFKVTNVVKFGYIISFLFLALINGLYVQMAIVFCLPLYWIAFSKE